MPSVFHAYGDRDDPLRLTVLLAALIRGLAPPSTSNDLLADIDVCLDPRAPVKKRINALGVVLQRNGDRVGPLVLVDPDALAWDGEIREPNGRGSVREAFYQTVIGSLDSVSWSLVRTSPGAALTRKLGELTVDAPAVSEETAIAAFAPECRAAAEWLVAEERLTMRDIDHIVDTVEAFDDHVLALAYDSLPESARKSARLVSAVRAPTRANGTFGPFKWANTPATDTLPRTDVDLLRRCGFLAADDPSRPDDLRVPRRVRRMLEAYAATNDTALLEIHRRMSADDFETRPLVEQLEVHFHAVRARDVDRAKKTARHYGVELRALAIALSREHHDHRAAAELFRYLLDNFDPNDAYAWEYWAYNLALWDRKEKAPGRHESEIREGYARADDIARHLNPLYRGRLLGYRAERGDDIHAEFNRGMVVFLRNYRDESDAVSRFAEPVLDGLFRAGNHALRQTILGEWHARLERFAPRVVAKHED